MEIETLLASINKMRVYLGKKEFLPDNDGTIKLGSFDEYGGSETFTIKNGCGIIDTWDISYHNGDYYNHQTFPMPGPEFLRLLMKMEDKYRAEVRNKIKYALEKEAIMRRMAELGFSARSE